MENTNIRRTIPTLATLAAMAVPQPQTTRSVRLPTWNTGILYRDGDGPTIIYPDTRSVGN